MSSDGTNNGNNADALAASKAIVKFGTEGQLVLSAQTMLTPVTGSKNVAKYRRSVTGAILRVSLSDPGSKEQWDTSIPKASKNNFVRGFLAYLSDRYRNASVSVTVVDGTGTVLALGDKVKGKSTITVLS
jgi:hypothetical protein